MPMSKADDHSNAEIHLGSRRVGSQLTTLYPGSSQVLSRMQLRVTAHNHAAMISLQIATIALRSAVHYHSEPWSTIATS
jgi:hypothetical protein